MLSLDKEQQSEVARQHGAKGKGKLVLSYSNLDELDGILGHLGLTDDY